MGWEVAAPYIASGAAGLMAGMNRPALGEKAVGFRKALPSEVTDYMNLDPEALLSKALRNIEGLGGVMVDRATQPVMLPGAIIQPTPRMEVRGGVSDVGLMGMDPALARPSLLGLPGVRMPEPIQRTGPDNTLLALTPDEKMQYLFPTAARGGPAHGAAHGLGGGQTAAEDQYWAELGVKNPSYQRLTQPASTQTIQPGTGMGEMAAALELIGVGRDAFGKLVDGGHRPTRGSEWPMFTGASGGYTGPSQTGPGDDCTPGSNRVKNAAGNCVCADGFIEVDGLCVRDPDTPIQQCPEGEVWHPDLQQCVPVQGRDPQEPEEPDRKDPDDRGQPDPFSQMQDPLNRLKTELDPILDPIAARGYPGPGRQGLGNDQQPVSRLTDARSSSYAGLNGTGSGLSGIDLDIPSIPGTDPYATAAGVRRRRKLGGRA
jgi:hypothetical protein